MVKHIILWNIKDDYSSEEKLSIKKNIKSGLEGLAGKIPGMTDIRVNIDAMPSSTAEVMLDSTFENAEALKNYSCNPLHVDVADTYVRPYTSARNCMDFEI